MSVFLNLDLKIWQPGEVERWFSARDLREKFPELSRDEQILKAIMIDNLGCGLAINGKVVSRCTFMFDGESSGDMLQMYEQHLPDLFEKKPVTIHFYEEMTSWRLTPEANEMIWEVLDTSQGISRSEVEQEGRCERLPFIKGAISWLTEAVSLLKRYQELVKKVGGQDLQPQIDMASRLLDFSKQTLIDMGWKP
ncbi:MAG: hypothetical protein IPK14_05130 [Blastocatellia bacterium]|nr:hypothetical protein [Blastocatellia bacterium]MBL8194267.1 hypothetical protein [Blastocatellia bacterium]MBN8723269.1 hypothetical protein [Acidobacteriota bacterium]